MLELGTVGDKNTGKFKVSII